VDRIRQARKKQSISWPHFPLNCSSTARKTCYIPPIANYIPLYLQPQPSHLSSIPPTSNHRHEDHHFPRNYCRPHWPNVSKPPRCHLSLLTDHSTASPTPVQSTCTITLPAQPFDAYSYSTTVTKTVHTACSGCALVTAHGGPTPDIIIPTTGTKTTTITACSKVKKAKESSHSSSTTSTTFLGTLPGDNKPSDCTFTTFIPLTVSVPTCYGHYVTSTQGIDCHGCGTYKNIAGVGPVRTCGTSAPAATGTSTVLACTV